MFFFVNCPTTIHVRYDAISDSTAKMSRPPPPPPKKWRTNKWWIKKLLLEFLMNKGGLNPPRNCANSILIVNCSI